MKHSDGVPDHGRALRCPPMALLILVILVSDHVLAQVGALARGKEIVRIISTLPRTVAEFRGVYGVAPTAAQFENLTRCGKCIAGLSSSAHFVQRQDQFHTLLDRGGSTHHVPAFRIDSLFAERSRYGPIVDVVIAHNIHGHVYFSDGTNYSLDELAEKETQNGRILVVISCHSGLYLDSHDRHIGLTRNIDVSEAVELTRAVRKYCNAFYERDRRVAPANESLEDGIRRTLKSTFGAQYRVVRAVVHPGLPLLGVGGAGYIMIHALWKSK